MQQIAIPGMVGYLRNADQQARVQTARSIFNAAQNALNSKYERGLKADFVSGDRTVDVSKINPQFKEDSGNINNIMFLENRQK